MSVDGQRAPHTLHVVRTSEVFSQVSTVAVSQSGRPQRGRLARVTTREPVQRPVSVWHPYDAIQRRPRRHVEGVSAVLLGYGAAVAPERPWVSSNCPQNVRR